MNVRGGHPLLQFIGGGVDRSGHAADPVGPGFLLIFGETSGLILHIIGHFRGVPCLR